MSKVWKQIDKYGKGKADLNMMKQAFYDGGIQLSKIDLEEVIKDFDQKHEGCISMQSFKTWWKSGFMGVSTFIRQLVAQKLYDMLLFEDIALEMSGYLKRYLGENEGLTKNNLQISINNSKIQKDGTELYIKAMLFS